MNRARRHTIESCSVFRPRQEDAPEPDIEKRFEDFGERLAAGIQERVLEKFERRLERMEAPSGAPADDASAVDDIAARMESLGGTIDARVRAALAKRGLSPKGS